MILAMKSKALGSFKEIKGDLISLAKKGDFDVIAHGCNCFSVQRAGIAAQMNDTFFTEVYPMEIDTKSPNEDEEVDNFFLNKFNKLGCIDYMTFTMQDSPEETHNLTVVNMYTQYNLGKDLNYIALELCLIKLNHIFRGMRVGLPMVGAGIAGGDWRKIKKIMRKTLVDVHLTVVVYQK